MDKKIKIGILIATIFVFFTCVSAIKELIDEPKSYSIEDEDTEQDNVADNYSKDDNTTEDITDEETSLNENIDDNEDIEETDEETYLDDTEDEDYIEYEDLSTNDKIETVLGIMANELVSASPSDYDITYQYEPSDNTGYIFITWEDVNELSHSDLNTLLDDSGLRSEMQGLANRTAEQLQTTSGYNKSTKNMQSCIVFRDLTGKTLYSCYNE